MICENKLKDVSTETIKTLNDCKIRTIMATGDNTLTAIAVAKHCNILNEKETVYYGDVQDNTLVWKQSNTLDDGRLSE